MVIFSADKHISINKTVNSPNHFIECHVKHRLLVLKVKQHVQALFEYVLDVIIKSL